MDLSKMIHVYSLPSLETKEERTEQDWFIYQNNRNFFYCYADALSHRLGTHQVTSWHILTVFAGFYNPGGVAVAGPTDSNGEPAD
jgi:hypothetical protein